MIDSFKVTAETKSNKLFMQLRGYFMKSEIELAFYLARKEIQKLKEGFEVVMDLDGMHTDKNLNNIMSLKAKHIFESLGAKRIRNIGVLNQLPKYKTIDLEHFTFESVGFYPN